MSADATTVVDLSGAEELCSEPAPLEQVKRAFEKLAPGDSLEVRSPIAEHAFAVRAWSRKQGVTVVSDERVDGTQRLVLMRSG
jgi:TusA-related sulfurtransferase